MKSTQPTAPSTMSELAQHCMRCGSGKLRIPNDKNMECLDCGFDLYWNPICATAVILRRANKDILLVKRANDPAKGTWDLPGGFADFGENFEEAARREITEELGIKISHLQYLGSFPNIYAYKDVRYQTIDVVLVADVGDVEIDLETDELLEFAWQNPQTLDLETVGLSSIRNALATYQKNL
jgi:NAD+ diphosphatase